jgi:hypothetical protein
MRLVRLHCGGSKLRRVVQHEDGHIRGCQSIARGLKVAGQNLALTDSAVREKATKDCSTTAHPTSYSTRKPDTQPPPAPQTPAPRPRSPFPVFVRGLSQPAPPRLSRPPTAIPYPSSPASSRRNSAAGWYRTSPTFSSALPITSSSLAGRWEFQPDRIRLQLVQNRIENRPRAVPAKQQRSRRQLV